MYVVIIYVKMGVTWKIMKKIMVKIIKKIMKMKFLII